MHIPGTIRRMAVIWDQSRMVKVLFELEESAVARFKDDPLTNKAGSRPGVWDEHLILEMIHRYCKPRNYWSRVLSSSVTDKFIDSQNNENFDHNANRNPEMGNVDQMAVSRSLLRVSDDKGPELLNGIYRWGKYYPGALPLWAQIMVQIVIALGTAIITVKLITSS